MTYFTSLPFKSTHHEGTSSIRSFELYYFKCCIVFFFEVCVGRFILFCITLLLSPASFPDDIHQTLRFNSRSQ